MCASCGQQVSVTAGTIFQDTRSPLTVWFRAIWWVVSQKNGASALGLQRILGLGSYRTAWTWLHKIRRAMIRPGRDRLTGEVEVDETFVGGVEIDGGRRTIGNKALVARRGSRTSHRENQDAMHSGFLCEKLGRIRAEHSEPDSIVITDGWHAYRSLPDQGYRHDRRVLLGSGESAEVYCLVCTEPKHP